MEATTAKTAYRCLPLAIANQSGWWMLCPVDFRVWWSGGPDKESLIIEIDDQWRKWVASHFGSGVLTFSVPYFFRTDYPYGLRVEGPTNFAVPGVNALTGLIETYGHVSTFTMNWRVTDVDRWVHFKRGWPVMQLSLHDFSLLETVAPELIAYDCNPDVEELKRWCAKRDDILKGRTSVKVDGSYTRNRNVAGEKLDAPHWTRVDLANFQSTVIATEFSENAMPIVTTPVPKPTQVAELEEQKSPVSMQQQVNRLRLKLFEAAELAFAGELADFRSRVSTMGKEQLYRYNADAFSGTPDLLALMYFRILLERASYLGLPTDQWQSAVNNKLEGL